MAVKDDVQSVARRNVETMLRRSGTPVSRTGAIFAEMVAEQAGFIRKERRRAVQFLDHWGNGLTRPSRDELAALIRGARFR